MAPGILYLRGRARSTRLDETRPEIAVISVGARNTYGHPAPEVVARLAAHGVQVHRTDREGTITLESDGQRVWTY